MWAVIDPLIRTLTTETQGSSVVETQAGALRLAIEMLLDTGFEPRVLTLR